MHVESLVTAFTSSPQGVYAQTQLLVTLAIQGRKRRESEGGAISFRPIQFLAAPEYFST